MNSFGGIYPAIVTPFTASGHLDEEAVGKLASFLIERGVDGFYVGGTTGEGLLQSSETRRRMVQLIVERARHSQTRVIAHVGACSTDDAVALAKAAADVGADAVSSIPPVFYRVSFAGLCEYYRTVAEATDLPLLIYHIPALSGVGLSLGEMGRLLDLENVVGIKFSDYNHFFLRQIREHHPESIVFSGNDEVFLPALVMGAHGSIGLTLNFMPQMYVGIYRAYRQGDLAEAQRLQFLANRTIEIVIERGSLGACKAMMKMLGIDCGLPRGPVMPIEGAASDELRQELESVGFFSEICQLEPGREV